MSQNLSTAIVSLPQSILSLSLSPLASQRWFDLKFGFAAILAKLADSIESLLCYVFVLFLHSFCLLLSLYDCPNMYHIFMFEFWFVITIQLETIHKSGKCLWWLVCCRWTADSFLYWAGDPANVKLGPVPVSSVGKRPCLTSARSDLNSAKKQHGHTHIQYNVANKTYTSDNLLSIWYEYCELFYAVVNALFCHNIIIFGFVDMPTIWISVINLPTWPSYLCANQYTEKWHCQGSLRLSIW